jgi:FKBP-type peptidyl-prolyl cis-trans isomerase
MLLFIISVTGCHNRERRNQEAASRMPDMEELIRANQIMVAEDDRRIAEKALQEGWDLTRTETGEYYQLLLPREAGRNESAEGTAIGPGDEVVLTYTLHLLGGEPIRRSAEAGLKRFIVEGSEAESGMHAVVKHFRTGDSVRIILPPHRAFGLMGDGDKIPGRAILWYEVRVDSVRTAV